MKGISREEDQHQTLGIGFLAKSFAAWAQSTPTFGAVQALSLRSAAISQFIRYLVGGKNGRIYKDGENVHVTR